MKSQRVDSDTPESGGQMTANEVRNGQVNEVFNDISRLDRVYGRVSMRKVFLSVQTDHREVYYGANAVLVEQAKDPHVNVTFFTTRDWFDLRKDARSRVESYLVRGPLAQMSLWGDHYSGTTQMTCWNHEGWPVPEVGDVLVFTEKDERFTQYVRVIDVDMEVQTFYVASNNSKPVPYKMQVIKMKLGSRLENDMKGKEVGTMCKPSDDDVIISTTVVADASRYYGMATLIDDAHKNDLAIRVDEVTAPLVPSAASQSSITGAGVGVSVSPILQSSEEKQTVTRSLDYDISPSSTLHIGEPVLPNTFTWNGGITLTDDGNGNIVNSGGDIIGAIAYTTGIITFSNPGIASSGIGQATYVPACAPIQPSQSGGIPIAINNQGTAYTFHCDPPPLKGSLRVEYLSGGKWYTMQDMGNGKITNPLDPSIGAGSINSVGDVSINTKGMPDVDSQIMFFWAKNAKYYDFSGDTLNVSYRFNLEHEGITRDTLVITWVGDGGGDGPDGKYGIVDNGNGRLKLAEYDSLTDDWRAKTGVENRIGGIKYAKGLIWLQPEGKINGLKRSEIFTIKYNYGDKITETFNSPPRDEQGYITLHLSHTPIKPNTFEIEWHTLLQQYDPKTKIVEGIDPTYTFRDDGNGLFEGDLPNHKTDWIQGDIGSIYETADDCEDYEQGTINYNNGEVKFLPDRRSVFPFPHYKWTTTEWMHPGMEQSYVFDRIQYLPAASIMPPDGIVTVNYVSTDGTNEHEYSGTLLPFYVVKPGSGLSLVEGSLKLVTADGKYIFDGADGNLYTMTDGVNGDRLKVGEVNYVSKVFSILEDDILLDGLKVISATGTSPIEPVNSMIFRTPGAPVRPGSLSIRAVTSDGETISGTSEFSGDIVGDGIAGHIDFRTGLSRVMFGKLVPNNAEAQAADWYNVQLVQGSNVWKPYSVNATTVVLNCEIVSYLPLDPSLLKLDPVRLALDGKVPIFRDGEIVLIHHSKTTTLPENPTAGTPYPCGRTDVNLIELYDTPDPKGAGQEYVTDFPEYIPEVADNCDINYTVDKAAGTVTLTQELLNNVGNDKRYRPPLRILNRIEDMVLASNVQVTGHISITEQLTHDYPAGETKVSSVLPISELQSRIYGEFVQEAWDNKWDDIRIGNPPLANYNFVDHPIMCYNTPSVKERWLILFDTPNTVKVIGEHLGVILSNYRVIGVSGLPEWDGLSSGCFTHEGVAVLIIANRNFPNGYYWKMALTGFGVGWNAGNCIRFNQDAANFPLWVVRTTLQAPPTEPVDNFILQVRGDSV